METSTRSVSLFSMTVTGWAEPHSFMRQFVLLKYLQVLVLPLKIGPLLAFGTLASFYTALLLNSPHVSRKASSVLLGQLAGADGLLMLCWALGALRMGLGVPLEVLDGLQQGLLGSHGLASLLLLGCVSLEAVLVSRRPLETRRLRTVHCARVACSGVWVSVFIEFLVLQAAKYDYEPNVQGLLIRMFIKACAFLAPFIQIVSFWTRSALWLANVWTCYAIFYNKPQRRKSCFH